MKIKFNVKGMMCGMCESHINSKIRNNFNVKKVKSSRRKGETLVVTVDEINPEDIAKIIQELGYEVSGWEIEE